MNPKGSDFMPPFDVTVVGELNLDLILYGLPESLEPEREQLADRLALTLGSSSAIFAHNLAALGSRVGFVSRIGTDPLGQIAMDRLAEGGVDVSRVRKAGGSTTTGLTIILTRRGYRNILTYPGTMNDMCYEDLDLEYLASGRHFHLASFFLHRGLRPRIAELFKNLKQAGLTTSLDTNDDPEDKWDDCREVLPYVDIFFPNEREAKKIAGSENLEESISRLSGLVPLVAVKLGRSGAIAQRGGERVTLPPMMVDAIDPVGAGDSFDAGFLHQFVRGASLSACLAGANFAGALSTTRPGGTEAFRDRHHLEQFKSRHWPEKSK
jgi:sugar/nucleoside kinase (ribokinase family)